MKYKRIVPGLLVALLFSFLYMIMSECKITNELHSLAPQMSALTVERSPNMSSNKSQELASPKERQDEEKGQIGRSANGQEVRDGPSLEHEVARRTVERVSEEFKMYVNAKLMQMKKQVSDPKIVKEINNILEISADIHKKLKNDQSKLANAVDGAGEWRKRENSRLTDLVQRRLEYLQNPSDCDKAKKIFCKLLTNGCGYGCQLHHVTFCLIMAYATQRTLILKGEGWAYSAKGWESLFLPISKTCRWTGGPVVASQWGPNSTTDSSQVIELPQLFQLSSRPRFLPLAIPEDLADRLTRIHGDPPAWWVGQFVTYVTRPSAMLQTFLNESKEKMNFTNPIVGVHVRRTDKIGTEALFHNVDEYMRHVEEWFDIYEKQHPRAQRKLYLASDDPGVLLEAKKNYPNYTFVSDNEVSKNANPRSRNTETSLHGIILDIYLLSRCDYLVCTLSSNVCRAAYELMQPLHGDASEWFKSLDSTYYVHGQNAHNFVSVEAHQSRREGEISFNVGDTIRLADNRWDGYCYGTNVNTGKSGLFPLYKTINEIERAKMPVYPEVPDLL